MKHLKIALLSVLLISFFVISTVAEEEENEKTEASITFVADDESATNPKDPEDPDLPGSLPGTGMNGKLTLDYLPNFRFGSKSIGSGVEVFKAIDLAPYIQVTDKRATGDGWKVQVSLGDFIGSNGSFKGIITLSNGENVTVSNNNSTAPSAITPIVITSGEGVVNVVVAAENARTGMGTWLTRWFPSTTEAIENDNVTLTVNTSNIIAGEYKAVLEWILTDAP